MHESYGLRAQETPQFLRVGEVLHETRDVVTLKIPMSQRYWNLFAFRPGQFNMLTAFGIGEVAISISGNPADTEQIVHTIRAVGPVSSGLSHLKAEDQVGIRGPFGKAWPVEDACQRDVLLIAGGLGLAPLRPSIYHLLNERKRYGRVALLYGLRRPADMLYANELEQWRRTPGFQVRVTADHADSDWNGDIGVVTRLLPKVRFDPLATVAMICGPELMIQVTAAALNSLGLQNEQIYVSMERNMKCAIGLCGHCQFGPHFICKDGPVFRFDQISPLLGLREI